MTTEQSQQEPNPQDTLRGGREVGVTFLDARKPDQELVFVRQAKVRELDKWSRSDEVQRLLITTELSEEDIDALTLESFEELVAADEAVTGPFAERRAERLRKRAAEEDAALKRENPEAWELMRQMRREAAEKFLTTPPSASAANSATPPGAPSATSASSQSASSTRSSKPASASAPSG